MALIDRELVSVFGEPPWEEVLLLAARAEERLAAWEEQVTLREREANAADERLRSQNQRLRHWEEELEAREQRTELVSNQALRPRVTNPKVGRNDPARAALVPITRAATEADRADPRRQSPGRDASRARVDRANSTQTTSTRSAGMSELRPSTARRTPAAAGATKSVLR